MKPTTYLVKSIFGGKDACEREGKRGSERSEGSGMSGSSLMTNYPVLGLSISTERSKKAIEKESLWGGVSS